jgi:hypothetical protein
VVRDIVAEVTPEELPVADGLRRLDEDGAVRRLAPTPTARAARVRPGMRPGKIPRREHFARSETTARFELLLALFLASSAAMPGVLLSDARELRVYIRSGRDGVELP